VSECVVPGGGLGDGDGALAPCASAALPDNGGRIFVASLAVAASAADPGTAVALVALHASTGARGDVLPPALAPQGALAFTVPPSAADTCTTAGLVSLEVLELLSF
jgi:hypothetical protein